MRRGVRWLVLGVALTTLALVGEGAPVAGAASVQADPEGTADWVQVSSGFYHTCGVRNTGRLYCWGEGNRGPLGTGGTGNASTPVEVAGSATDWRSVSAGSKWTCAIKTNGTLWCWGRDDFGQVGNGPGSANVERPTAVGTNADWTTVSTGGYHTCGRRSNGRLYCWGDDQDGAIGDGGGLPGTDRSVPTQVAGARTDWTSVASGITHACARRSSGRLFCWGSDIFGGIGNGPPNDNSAVTAPVQVAGGATDWKAVYAGSYVTCATKVSGRLYCWGDDFEGQNGVGTLASPATRRSSPAQVAGGATDWKNATIGNLHVCGRRATNRIYCWGDGFFGQRGDGLSGQPGNAPQPTPTEVS